MAQLLANETLHYYFLSHRANTSFQHKWVFKLLGYDYEIQYKHERDNIVVVVLSRVHNLGNDIETTENEPDRLMELITITYPYFGWLDELRRDNETDEWIKQKLQEVTVLKPQETQGHSSKVSK